jgi:hypothetical protein
MKQRGRMVFSDLAFDVHLTETLCALREHLIRGLVNV